MPDAALRAASLAHALSVPLSPAPAFASRRAGGGRTTLLVLADQRWGVVYQRLQHLLARLARHLDVIVVEEPVADDMAPGHLVASNPAAGVEVLVPHLPARIARADGLALAAVAELLRDALAERAVASPIAWFASPMPLPLLASLPVRAVVYDRRDDAGAAAPEARSLRAERDAALMARADLVLTASPTLHKASSARHARARFVADAIDADHFDAGRLWERSVEAADAAALHAGLPWPRLGWYGAIDERVDLALVEAVAARRPDWQLVMAGPVLLPPGRALPQRANLHWLGRQSWALLPYLQSQWDVCLLPIVRGPATRCHPPTRALEALAGGRPVVSTALPDVVARLGGVVRTADGVDGFIAACEATLDESPAERARRRDAGRVLARQGDWDAAAGRIWSWLAALAAAPAAEPAPAWPPQQQRGGHGEPARQVVG